MSRRAGRKKIAVFRFNDTAEEFPIYLDMVSGEFSIDLGIDHNLEIFKGQDLKLVKNEAYRYLEAIRKADWKPVIVVGYEDGTPAREHRIFIRYDRFFVADKSDGSRVWKQYVGGTEDGFPGQNTFERGDGKLDRILPYTPEAWRGLEKISDMVDALNDRIRVFIGRADLEKRLLEIESKVDLGFFLEGPKKEVSR